MLEQGRLADDPAVPHEIHIVKQVVIKIGRAAPLQLLLKNGFRLFFSCDRERGKFRREDKGHPRIPAHQAGPHRFLARSAVIDRAGVKICKSRHKETVRHILHRVQINVRRIIRAQRKAHHPETEFAAAHVLIPSKYELRGNEGGRIKIHLSRFCDIVPVIRMPHVQVKIFF